MKGLSISLPLSPREWYLKRFFGLHMNKVLLPTIIISGAFLGFAPYARAGGESGKLILNDDAPALVKVTLDLRTRYEFGDQHGLRDSHAGTIRERVGLLTRNLGGFQGFVEYEGTQAVDRQSYSAGSAHGPANRTPIVDPESNELNQAWLSYSTDDSIWNIKAGRQAINLDNQRYVGGVAWRQNMQTFDAVGVTWKPAKNLEVYYGHLWQINRIFGSDVIAPGQQDFTGQSNVLNVKYSDLPIGTLTTYIYAFDLHNAAGDANSNNSYGATLTGLLFDTDVTYFAEYAYQTDGAQNPRDYGVSYAHGTLSKTLIENVKGTLGLEYLGSDNGIGYNFPLGTNHAFNGYADRFLATPAGGLTDAYASLGTTFEGIKLLGAYHYFWDDGFDIGLGQEIDIVASKDLGRGLSVLAKGARFWGENGQPDTTRVSLELDYKY
jgi:Alginate export